MAPARKPLNPTFPKSLNPKSETTATEAETAAAATKRRNVSESLKLRGLKMGCEEGEEMKEREKEKRKLKRRKRGKDQKGVMGRRVKERKKMKDEGIDCHIKKLRNLLVKRTSGFDGVGDIDKFGE